MRWKIILLSFLLFGVSCAKSAYSSDHAKVESIVSQYMEDVFGASRPSLNTYYQYEGQKSENEYEQELLFCREKWSNGKKIDLGEFATHVPKECTDWLIERSNNPKKSDSLYYKKVRSKISGYSGKYYVRSITKIKNGYTIDIDMKPRGVLSLLYTSAIDDPDDVKIFISKILKLRGHRT